MGAPNRMFLPGALSDCDLFAEACGVVPVLGWPADPSGGLLDQLLAPWLPTSDTQQRCDSNIIAERECFVREPVAAAADAGAGNMQDDPDPTTADPAVLPGSTIDAGMRDLGIAPRQGAPGHGTAAATAPSSASMTSIPGVTRKAARGARAASSDNTCAQSPAPTEHSSKRKRASASDLCQAQNRNRAADCRSSFRQRTTETTLETVQQEARDSAAKVEFLKACFAEEACGALVLALFDQFCAR